eukprot:8967874-Pyramimonas_sp.AAC.1
MDNETDSEPDRVRRWSPLPPNVLIARRDHPSGDKKAGGEKRKRSICDEPRLPPTECALSKKCKRPTDLPSEYLSIYIYIHTPVRPPCGWKGSWGRGASNG